MIYTQDFFLNIFFITYLKLFVSAPVKLGGKFCNDRLIFEKLKCHIVRYKGIHIVF